MPFFIRNKRSKAPLDSKKKGGKKSAAAKNAIPEAPKSKVRKKDVSEEIQSDEDLSGDELKRADYSSTEDEEDVESAQEKRLRLAKQYLAQIETEADEEDDDSTNRDLISKRIRQDILEQAGRLQKDIARDILPPSTEDIRILRGHQLSITCVVLSTDDKYIFSASKDCSIIKWEVSSGRRVHVIAGGRKGTEKTHIGHTSHVLSMAISTDNRFLASGDRNKLIHIWNPETCELLHTFKGHRDAVSGLAFRKGSHQLFSASHDRSVKIWNLDEMAYVETLFGHQDVITGIDSLTRERAVTSGARDGSVRVWKVVEESQLVFHGHAGSIDCVALINEEHFISGADDNSLALWSVMKKKPATTLHNAHGGDAQNNPLTTAAEHWITSVAALQNTDLVASGSKDGFIRLWQCGSEFRSLTHLLSIPMAGFVNSMKFSSDGSFLVAGIGQEHRLGRWWRLQEAKNSIAIIRLPRSPDVTTRKTTK